MKWRAETAAPSVAPKANSAHLQVKVVFLSLKKGKSKFEISYTVSPELIKTTLSLIGSVLHKSSITTTSRVVCLLVCKGNVEFRTHLLEEEEEEDKCNKNPKPPTIEGGNEE